MFPSYMLWRNEQLGSEIEQMVVIASSENEQHVSNRKINDNEEESIKNYDGTGKKLKNVKLFICSWNI